jgi:hypothetical protein
MIRLEARPVQAPGVVGQRTGETIILLDPGSGKYYTLDEVGARIWELCDGINRVADFISVIEAEYDAPSATVQADVLDLLEDLERERLVAAD